MPMGERDNKEYFRRRRVNFIKRAILFLVIVAIMTPTVLCIWLSFRISSLEQKMEILQHRNIVVEKEPSLQSGSGNHEETQGDSSAEKDTQKDTQEPQDDRRKVYLTFDDGPSENTDKILDILKAYDVKATFFVIGNQREGMKERYQRILAEGHTLGIHSYSHDYAIMYANMEAYEEDVLAIQQYVYDVTGFRPVLYRFPGGSSNTISKVDIRACISFLNRNGLTYFDWNVSSQDASVNTKKAEEILENVLNDVVLFDSSVVLMHDSATKSTTVEALPLLIEKLRAMDAVLLPITSDTEPVQHIKAD